MTALQARDPDFEHRVRDSFARQPFMGLLGIELVDVRPGAVEMRVPYREELTQQHGYLHGGLVGTLADCAAGYAAYSLMAAEDTLLTVEFKLNLMAPATGEALVCRGRVVRPGRTLTVCQSDVYGLAGGEEKHCATALCTLMTLAGRADAPPV